MTDDMELLMSDPRPLVALNLMSLYLFSKNQFKCSEALFWVDGIFGSFACWKNGIHSERVPGRNLVERILAHIVNTGAQQNLVILGGPSETPKIKALVRTEFSSVEFPMLEEKELYKYDYDRFSKQDIILIAIGSPKQEKIASIIYSKIGAKCICCGGAVNMLEGFESSAPLIISKMGLESIYRLKNDTNRRLKRLGMSLFSGTVGLFSIRLRKVSKKREFLLN